MIFTLVLFHTILLPKHILQDAHSQILLNFPPKLFRATVPTLKVLENLLFLKSETSIFLSEAVSCLHKHNPIATER